MRVWLRVVHLAVHTGQGDRLPQRAPRLERAWRSFDADR